MGEYTIKQRISNEMKTAMRTKDKKRLGTIRLILAAIKQKEIDTKSELSDVDVFSILNKMIKQRRNAINQYEKAGRDELATQEKFEISVIQTYLPKPLDKSEIVALIDGVIVKSGAQSIKDMGKVMAILKPQLQGRADMSVISQTIKTRLDHHLQPTIS